jgi:hypothetical protein
VYINNHEKTSLESAPFQYNVIVFQQDPKIHVLFYRVLIFLHQLLIILHYLEICVVKKTKYPSQLLLFLSPFLLIITVHLLFCNAKTRIKHIFCLTSNPSTQHTPRPTPAILQNHHNFKQSNTNLQNIPTIKHK